MAVDYDLVIIGDTLEGRIAALKFAQSKARVALIQQPMSDRIDCGEDLWLQGLGQLLTTQREREWFTAVGMIPPFSADPSPQLDYETLCAGLSSARERQEEALSWPLLAITGVDVIAGSGEFVRWPELRFVLPDRKLRSRFYLLATGASYHDLKIAGLAEVTYLTPPQLQQPEVLQALPPSLTIVGNRPIAVTWAQVLQRLGHSVTLLSRSPLLPSCDRTLVWRLQAQLEAEGIQVSASPIQRVSPVSDRLQLQLADRSLETDGLILVSRLQPNLWGFNKEGVGLQSGQNRLAVNVHLQTTHPRIYACGRIIHQQSSPQIAEQEIKTILKNLVFFPLFTPKYSLIPSVNPTFPPLATVGLTEKRAIAQFGGRIAALQQSLAALPKIQGSIEGLGYIKLIVLDNRQILGAHFLGEGAEEMISFFALAIRQKIHWTALTKIAFPRGTFAEGIQKLIEAKSTEKTRQYRWRQAGLETHWLWRRGG